MFFNCVIRNTTHLMVFYISTLLEFRNISNRCSLRCCFEIPLYRSIPVSGCSRRVVLRVEHFYSDIRHLSVHYCYAVNLCNPFRLTMSGQWTSNTLGALSAHHSMVTLASNDQTNTNCRRWRPAVFTTSTAQLLCPLVTNITLIFILFILWKNVPSFRRLCSALWLFGRHAYIVSVGDRAFPVVDTKIWN